MVWHTTPCSSQYSKIQCCHRLLSDFSLAHIPLVPKWLLCWVCLADRWLMRGCFYISHLFGLWSVVQWVGIMTFFWKLFCVLFGSHLWLLRPIRLQAPLWSGLDDEATMCVFVLRLDVVVQCPFPFTTCFTKKFLAKITALLGYSGGMEYRLTNTRSLSTIEGLALEISTL